MTAAPWNIGPKLKASEWVKRYAADNGFSIYSKQIGAVLAFFDACGLSAVYPDKSKAEP
jgi:hypothetical protein